MSTDRMPEGADVLAKPLSKDKHYFRLNGTGIREIAAIRAKDVAIY